MSAAKTLETFATRFELVPLDEIAATPDNPRKFFDEEAMKELIASVAEKGVEVPLILRPIPASRMKAGKKYELVAGERRFRAAKAAKLEKVKAEIRFDLEADKSAFETSLVENMDRESLTALEEGEAYKTLNEAHKVSVEDIAKKFGKKIETVYGRMKLTSLKGEARKLVQAGTLDGTMGVLIARLPTEQLQQQALEVLREEADNSSWRSDGDEALENLTFRDAKDALAREFTLKLKDAGWKLDDAQLVPAAGACLACPKRTGANAALFPDVKGDTCLDKPCFDSKKKAWAEVAAVDVADKALAKGAEVLPPVEGQKALRSSNFINPKDSNYRDDKGRSWGEVLGKAAEKLTPIVAIDEDGKAHNLFKREEVEKVLKAEGKARLAPSKAARSSSSSHVDWQAKEDARRAREQKESARRERATSKALEQLVAKVEGSKETTATFLRTLMPLLVDHYDRGTSKRRGFKSMTALLDATAKMPEPKLRGLAMELAIGESAWLCYGGWRSDWLGLTKRFGIDLKKLEQEEVEAEKAVELAKKLEAEKAAEAEAAKAKTEKKPEPKKEEKPAKKAAAGVNPKTGKTRHMVVEEA